MVSQAQTRPEVVFFASRVINIWNSPPQSTDFSSINAFKRSICSAHFLSFQFLSCKFVLYVCFCTNFVYKLLFFFNTTYRLVLKCAHQYYQIVFIFFILTSFFIIRCSCQCTSCLAVPAQTVVSCTLYTLHLFIQKYTVQHAIQKQN